MEPVFLSLPGSERTQIEAFKAELVVPLKNAGELTGLLVLARKRSEEPYSEEDLSLLRAAANQTAMGLAPHPRRDNDRGPILMGCCQTRPEDMKANVCSPV